MTAAKTTLSKRLFVVYSTCDIFTALYMYTKEQASQLKQSFWTTFGQYMRPVLSSEGMRINWINYKTGIRYISFKTQAGKDKASIAIEIAHPDEGIQELFFEQFKELKSLLHSSLNEEWDWVLHTKDENNKTVSRIYKELDQSNVYNEKDWPSLISFFKPRLIALDQFWSDAKDIFDSLK